MQWSESCWLSVVLNRNRRETSLASTTQAREQNHSSPFPARLCSARATWQHQSSPRRGSPHAGAVFQCACPLHLMSAKAGQEKARAGLWRFKSSTPDRCSKGKPGSAFETRPLYSEVHLNHLVKPPLFCSDQNAHMGLGLVGDWKKWMLMVLYCSKITSQLFHHCGTAWQKAPCARKEARSLQQPFQCCPNLMPRHFGWWWIKGLGHFSTTFYKNLPGMPRTLWCWTSPLYFKYEIKSVYHIEIQELYSCLTVFGNSPLFRHQWDLK